jgi:integrase
VYIERTEEIRPKDSDPVFVSLKAPYKALTSSSIAKILGQAITLAGLGDRGFSAKNFRPSAATAAVNAKVPYETAMQLGRWKTKEVFMNHYVYPSAPDDYTENMVSGKFDA